MWNSGALGRADDEEGAAVFFRRATPPDDEMPAAAPLPADSRFARTRQRGDR